MDAGYWLATCARPSVSRKPSGPLAEQGFGAFIECSAHPVLTAGVQETAEEAAVVGSLRRGNGGAERMTLSLAEAFVRGVPVTGRARSPGPVRARWTSPTYAFQRRRYWWDLESVRQTAGAAGDPVDAAFWAAVEAADLESLAATLDVGDDSLSQVLPALTLVAPKTAHGVHGGRLALPGAVDAGGRRRDADAVRALAGGHARQRRTTGGG